MCGQADVFRSAFSSRKKSKGPSHHLTEDATKEDEKEEDKDSKEVALTSGSQAKNNPEEVPD